MWADLNTVAKAARTRPLAWLEQEHLYGDLAAAPRFVDAFEDWLRIIWLDGTDAALEQYIGQ